MFAPHAALRLQHLKRVHVTGHFRTLSEARDVSRSFSLLFSSLLSFQSCSTMFWIHYSPRLCASTTQRSTSENESILQYLTVHSLALHLACFSKMSRTELYCGQLWRWFCRVKHAKRQGRRRFAESFGSFVGTIGGPHWRRVGLTSDCKKVFRHGSAQFTILRSCWPQATCI